MCVAMCSDVLCQAGVTGVTSLVLHLPLTEGICLDPHGVQVLGYPLTMALAVSGLQSWLPWQQKFQLTIR